MDEFVFRWGRIIVTSTMHSINRAQTNHGLRIFTMNRISITQFNVAVAVAIAVEYRHIPNEKEMAKTIESINKSTHFQVLILRNLGNISKKKQTKWSAKQKKNHQIKTNTPTKWNGMNWNENLYYGQLNCDALRNDGVWHSLL